MIKKSKALKLENDVYNLRIAEKKVRETKNK